MPFVTPDVLGVRRPAVVAGNSYLGVWVEGEEEAGDFRWLHLWSYVEGAFQSVIRADVEIPDIGNARLSESLQVIPTDPAGLVADGSLIWGDGAKIWAYDPVAETLYEHTCFGVASVPIWGFDGWVYFLDNLTDSADFQLWRIRADMTAPLELSTVAIAADFEVGRYWLTGEAYYALGEETSDPFEAVIVGKWPLDGSPPSSLDIGTPETIPAAPLRHGLPLATDDAIYAQVSGSNVMLGQFTGPDTLALLWPGDYAEWEDPGGTARPILSLSLSADRSEAILYAALADGGSTRGIIRSGLGVIGGGAPTVVEVEDNDGTFPDFMFALD